MIDCPNKKCGQTEFGGSPIRQTASPSADRIIHSSQNVRAISDEQLARKFVDQRRDELRYDHTAKNWFRWGGPRWVPDRTGHTFEDIRRFVEQEYLNAEVVQSSRSASFVSGIEKLAQTDQRIAVTAEQWNGDPYLLGTPDGTIDLRDGAMRQADPDDLITKVVASAPSDKVDCPRWKSFLLECSGGDRAVVDFLQRFCGYLLTGETREHALMFVYGPGGNGKSVFVNTIASALNDYATVASMETFTASRFERHPEELAGLAGARLVTASETEEGRAWAENKIKQLTGGDPIRARHLYRSAFVFKPQFKLMFVGNHTPVLNRVDDAIRRRFLIVPFDHKPKAPDLRLEEKLSTEFPGILRWMIDGCLAWQAEGLNPPASILASTKEYFDEQDVFGQWLEDNCETGPTETHFVPTKRLFSDCWAYAQDRDHDAGNAISFGAELRKRGFTKGTKRINNKPTKCWFGLRLRTVSS